MFRLSLKLQVCKNLTNLLQAFEMSAGYNLFKQQPH